MSITLLGRNFMRRKSNCVGKKFFSFFCPENQPFNSAIIFDLHSMIYGNKIKIICYSRKNSSLVYWTDANAKKHFAVLWSIFFAYTNQQRSQGISFSISSSFTMPVLSIGSRLNSIFLYFSKKKAVSLTEECSKGEIIK